MFSKLIELMVYSTKKLVGYKFFYIFCIRIISLYLLYFSKINEFDHVYSVKYKDVLQAGEMEKEQKKEAVHLKGEPEVGTRVPGVPHVVPGTILCLNGPRKT